MNQELYFDYYRATDKKSRSSKAGFRYLNLLSYY